jgi:choice-of-anchor A domain-containing protein/fibro-slime domain-containing protein
MKVITLVSLCFLASVFADQTILATVRDFNTALPDFERFTQVETGAVISTLDQDGKPILKSGTHVAFSAPQWFTYWYRDVENINIPFTFNLNMVESSGTYSYSNAQFFPIDGMGWGNYPVNGPHNYDFTTEFNLFFTYGGGETFSFQSANDMWVFVNNQLVVDLGGINNPAASASLSIDNIAAQVGISIGQNVEIDIFHAQRNSQTASAIAITTDAVLSSFPSNEPVAIPGTDVYICEVLLQNYCPGAPVNPPTLPGSTGSGSTGSTGDSTGSPYDDEGIPSKKDVPCTSQYPTLTFVSGGSSYGFDNFNVISFGDFSAPSGDIEGRLAVRNDLNLPGDYSVGYQLRTGGVTAWDTSLPYAVVVGHDATWASGDIYPDGSNSPYNGEEEGMYVGGTFSGSADLTLRRTGGPCPVAGCLDSQFDSAQIYFSNVQNDFSAISDNVQSAIQYGSLTITCSDNTAESISLTVDGASFSTITSYTLNNCNRYAQIVINIGGTSDVLFAGDQIDHDAEKVVYNVLGSGRTISIQTAVSGSILAPYNLYSQVDSGVVIGNVIVASVEQALQINRLHCLNPAPSPHPPSDENICPGFETNCNGLDLPLGDSVYSFRDFNVITFDSFVAATGDIEGRLAAKNDVTLGAGYSIGYQLQTTGNSPDNYLPYSLVVGRDLTWVSGALYPDGSGFPYAGQEEDAFVGGTVDASTETDLQTRVKGHCNTPGCLDTYFNAAQQCYEGYQTDLASQSDNVQQTVSFSGLFLTCNDVNAEVYFVTLTSSVMNSYTYTSVDNCNFQADWVINIIGTDDVTITGDSFPAVCGGVVYNIQGSGRTITVTDTSVCGHILAPQNTLYQKDGVIVGKVVAGDISFALQINKQNNCPNPGLVNLPTVVTTPANTETTYLQVQTGGNIRPGDTLYFDGQTQTNTVSGVSGNTIYLTNPLTQTVESGTVAYATVDGTMGRPPNSGVVPSSSSSSVISVAFSLLVVLLALAF